jgi:hypothetical protein
MAQKKKNPYQRAQRQFVQARAQEKGFEEMTPDQREQLRNRFAKLAQTKEGRTTIAQKVLSQATPEQRKEFKQRLAQNLPSRASGDISSTGSSLYSPQMRDTESQRMQARRGMGNMGPVKPKTTTQTTTQKKTSGPTYLGSGSYALPTNVSALKKDLAATGRGTVEQFKSYGRTFISPTINLAGRIADVLGGVQGKQKFKPLPQSGFKEAAINTADVGIGIATGATGGAVLSSAAKRALIRAGESRILPSVVRQGAQYTASNIARNQTIRQSLLQAERSGALNTIRARGTGNRPIGKGKIDSVEMVEAEMRGLTNVVREAEKTAPKTRAGTRTRGSKASTKTKAKTTAAPVAEVKTSTKTTRTKNVQSGQVIDIEDPGHPQNWEWMNKESAAQGRSRLSKSKVIETKEVVKPATSVKAAPAKKNQPKKKASVVNEEPKPRTVEVRESDLAAVEDYEGTGVAMSGEGRITGSLSERLKSQGYIPETTAAPTKKKAPTQKKAPKQKTAPVAKVEPAKKPVEIKTKASTGPKTVGEVKSRSGLSVQTVGGKDINVVGPAKIKTSTVTEIPISSKSLPKERAERLFSKAEDEFFTAKKNQVKRYTGEVEPPRTHSERTTDIIGPRESPREVSAGQFEYFKEKFPNMSRRQFNLAERRAGRTGDLESAIKEMMAPVSGEEAGMMRVTGGMREQIKAETKKKANKQKRKIAKEVKELRQTKGVWKGI